MEWQAALQAPPTRMHVRITERCGVCGTVFDSDAIFGVVPRQACHLGTRGSTATPPQPLPRDGAGELVCGGILCDCHLGSPPDAADEGGQAVVKALTPGLCRRLWAGPGLNTCQTCADLDQGRYTPTACGHMRSYSFGVVNVLLSMRLCKSRYALLSTPGRTCCASCCMHWSLIQD